MQGSRHDNVLHHLTNDLRAASDRAILKVTHMIDILPDRGAADQLLGPIRNRLGALDPPRPPRVRRILFSPLDPVIIPTSQWGPGCCAIPRGLLKPLADFIEGRLPAATHDMPHEQIWAEAASILGAGCFPESWKEPDFQVATGIRPNLLPPLVEIVKVVLCHAAKLGAFGNQDRADIDLVRPLLLDAARSGPLGWRVVLALLSAGNSRPARLAEQLLSVTQETRFARQLNESVGLVLGQAIDRLDTEAATLAGACLATEAAIEARIRLAEKLVSYGEMQGELEFLSKRAGRHRPKIAAQLSEEIAATLRELPGRCLAGAVSTLQAEDEAAMRIEAMLEAVHRLDNAARPLGDLERRDQILEQAAATMAGPEMPAWLTRADRLRLCEILVGPEAALRIVGS